MGGQRDQADDAAGRGVMQRPLTNPGVPGQSHRPGDDDVDAVDRLALVRQAHAWFEVEAGTRPQDLLTGGDEGHGETVRGLAQCLQHGRAY